MSRFRCTVGRGLACAVLAIRQAIQEMHYRQSNYGSNQVKA